MSYSVILFIRRFTLISMLLAAGSGTLMAQQAAPGGWADFTKMFDATMERDRVVGAGILLLRDGNLVSHHEQGFADRATSKRVTERTIFHYGSITRR